MPLDHGLDVGQFDHSHIHAFRDYIVDEIPIICNPARRSDEATGFDAGMIVTIG